MVVLAVIGALVAVAAPAAPTGIAGVDALYRAAAGAVLPLAGGRSRRHTWIISSLMVLWFTPSVGGRVLALVALAASLWSVRAGRRRVVGAGVGTALTYGLFHLGAGPFVGSTALLAVAAATPMVWSALRRVEPSAQRWMRRTIMGLFAAAVVATAAFGFAFVLSLGPVDNGVAAVQVGYDEAAEGRTAAAAAEFEEASDHFDRGRRLLGGPWTLPARLVPVVGQHVRAAQVVAGEGTSLTEVAADTVETVDPDGIAVGGGCVDVDAIDELAPTFDRVDRSLTRAADRIDDVRNPWLIPQTDVRLEALSDELADAQPAASTAAAAATQVPVMLGASSPTRWLVLLTNPAEARGLSGLVGNYVLMSADDGCLEIEDSGRNEDLNRLLEAEGATLTGPPGFVDRWGRFDVDRLFQDVTLSPDLPEVATVAADLFAQATGASVDGVVTVDPAAMEVGVALSGPIRVGDVVLDGRNTADFVQQDQYAIFDGDEDARVAALDELVRAAFESFVSADLPGPRALADRFGPVVESDRLGVWWADNDRAIRDLIDDVGLDGAFPLPEGRDLLGLVHQNAAQNKIDPYLQRDVIYEVTTDGDDIEASVTVSLRNDAPSEGLPDAVIGSNDQGLAPGTNLAYLSVHTALDVVSVSTGDDASALTPTSEFAREATFGAEALSLTVEVPAGERREARIELRGRLDDRDTLVIPAQPLINPDRITVRVDGEEVVTDRLVDRDLVLDLR